MSAELKTLPAITRAKGMADRVRALDWERLGTDLDAQGSAMIERLLTAHECRALAALYDDEQRFRSRVVMARHGFGRGEYKYFAYPLPVIPRRPAAMDYFTTRRKIARTVLRPTAEPVFARLRQMAFVSGPRQVGKTTTCRALGSHYLNWDSTDDRRLILRGPNAVAEQIGLEQLRAQIPLVALDELHKYPKWKAFLKGFFDVYGPRVRVIVTGSSRLDITRRGSDSLMGRHFFFRMHPWSAGECARTDPPEEPVQPPVSIANDDWDALIEHGGFPEPFLTRDTRFSRRWRSLRQDQLTKGDLRDSSQQLIYSNLSREIGVSVDTTKRWVDLLVRLHYGFLVRPWFRNVAKALRKEPKWFVRDWSGIADAGARAETLVACHLLKAVEGWSDLGLGQFELHYLRDKQKRKVDFLVVRDRKPWFLGRSRRMTRHSPNRSAISRSRRTHGTPSRRCWISRSWTPIASPARSLWSYRRGPC